MATLAAMLTAVLVASQPVDAASHLGFQGYVNGHPDSPKYDIGGGWVVGESMTVTIYDTAAKGTVVFTETFDFTEGGPRGVGPSAPGKHFVVTQGADMVEFTLVDLDIDVDGIENTVFGTAPVPASLNIVPHGAAEGTICSRGFDGVGGDWLVDYDDPVANPEEPGCEPTWDLMPGDFLSVTDNGPADGADCCQSRSQARVIDFIDDDTSIFEEDMTWLAQKGITKGCNPPANDRFCPDSSVTRGVMAAFLVRALEYTDDGGGNLFTDDDASIFESDIDKLGTAGVTKGCNPPTNDKFCPDAMVTRGQMAAFLVRALGYVDDGGGDLFTDDDASIFESDIDRLATAGVTKGCNPPANDRFCPDAVVTRGPMAAFLRRALG